MDAAHFSATVEPTPQGTVIHVRGDIDLETAAHLRDAIEPHLGPDQRIVLDLSEVTFMDSACLSVLLHARSRLTADGGSLILRNPSSAAHRLLTAAQVQELLDAIENPQDSN